MPARRRPAWASACPACPEPINAASVIQVRAQPLLRHQGRAPGLTSSSGTPHRRALGQGGSLSHWHQKLQTTNFSLPLCVGTMGSPRALPARERKSRDNELPSPHFLVCLKLRGWNKSPCHRGSVAQAGPSARLHIAIASDMVPAGPSLYPTHGPEFLRDLSLTPRAPSAGTVTAGHPNVHTRLFAV